MMIIFCLGAALPARGQDLEAKLLRLLEENELDQIYKNLELIKERFPDQPLPYYVEAFIEKDGDYALRLYEEFVRKFPTSKYTASARYKIAQYYYLKASYQQALKAIDDLLEYHQDSPLEDDAAYLRIRILIATKKMSDARLAYSAFTKLYPQSFFRNILKFDFEQGSPRNVAVDSRKTDKRDQFTLQVGAFSKAENANFLARQITARGYPAQVNEKVINGQLFHLVWVGNFESSEQAEAFGELFKREFDIPLRVVRKD